MASVALYLLKVALYEIYVDLFHQWHSPVGCVEMIASNIEHEEGGCVLEGTAVW